MIERNTTIPTKKSEIFSTAADNQSSVEIHIVQGERPMATENKSLGRFILDGIPPAPRGVPKVEVTFDIDANGILSVSAKDMATSREQKITITASSGLSKQEIDRLKREAEEHAAEDSRKRELIEARNQGDGMAYTAEKTLRDFDAQIPSDIKDEVNGKVSAVRSALQGDDVERIRSTTQELAQSVQKIGSAMYGQQPGGTSGGYDQQQPEGESYGDQSGQQGDNRDKTGEGTVEGEYREV